MPETQATQSGPTLEQILWRAMDRWEERPALVDSEEFARHIEAAFDGDVPAEEWVARFFDGSDKLHKAPADMAEAIVRATKDRLHVYEFDLNRLEYVIVEDEEKVVVVSDFGQFALRNDDVVTRAIEAAIIPSGGSSASGTAGNTSGTRSSAALERGKGSEPKAYFVRASGEVVAVDVKKVARSLEQLLVKQVSMPAVDKAGSRMMPFAPARRKLTESTEARVLRQDKRTQQAVPPPPRLERTRASDKAAGAPSTAATAVFVLMPDGSLARPEIGSASRWQEMLGNYARQAASATPVTQRMFLQAGPVVAVINSAAAAPVTAGEKAQARSQNLSAVRGGMTMPVKVLGDDQLAAAIAQGAKVVPGFAAGDRFWVQPEAAFKPDASKLPELAPKNPALVSKGEPLELGEITGDPWADWALAGGGGDLPAAIRTALLSRAKSGGGAGDDGDLSIPPELATKLRGVQGQDLMLPGQQVVGFRSPDGTIVMQSARGQVRLAAIGRGGEGNLQPIDLQLPGSGAPIAARSGALPATALAALQMALEQTANAGGYQLPMMRIVSAPDALDVGAAMDLTSFDERRREVRIAGPSSWYDGGAGNQVAQLVLSMPFPNQGEMHVGSDLAEALQAYLGGSVQPMMGAPAGLSLAPLIAGGAAGAGAGGVVFKLRDGGNAGSAFGDDLPLDWSGLHLQASQKARDAVITFDLPEVQPLVAGSSSVSGLPALLQRALAQTGDWTPGPGAPMPLAIRDLALRGPFDAAAGPELISFSPAQSRPLNPGEEEIVIPMPLWAQMGRGKLSETDQIMASPLAPAGYSPPLGIYRLVVPGGGPVDMSGGAPPGTPGVIELTGPTGLELAFQPKQGAVLASSLGGNQILGRVAMDDGQSVVSRRGRIRIGAPIKDTPSQDLDVTSDSVPSATPDYGQGQDSILSQGGPGADSSPAIVSGSPQSYPTVDAPSGTYVDGTFTGGGVSGAGAGSSMAGALSSAMQMSADVDARTSMPSRPSIGGASGSASSATPGSASGFRQSAQAAGQQQAAGSIPSSSSQPAVVTGATPDSTSGVNGGSAMPVSNDSGSTGAAVQSGVDGAATGAQTAAAVTQMTRASSSAKAAAQQSSQDLPATYVTGLSPGMWSGHERSHTVGYQSWRYSSEGDDEQQSFGGITLGSLSKPQYPSLPTSLRFRYVGAPLWWSNSTGGGATASDDQGGEDSTPASRAMRAGLRAATSAASIWRSILVASPRWGGGADDLSGGMDAGRDANADDMSSLARNFDALTAGALVGAGAVGGTAGAGAAYIAMDGSGNAGTVSKQAAARRKADSVEMSIVAAIPPAPPPLETMGSGATGGDAPHARAKGHGHGHGKHDNKENSDAVSHSKIEGSVDAIAQRIYHRIRRRIQSDRERFGG